MTQKFVCVCGGVECSEKVLKLRGSRAHRISRRGKREGWEKESHLRTVYQSSKCDPSNHSSPTPLSKWLFVKTQHSDMVSPRNSPPLVRSIRKKPCFSRLLLPTPFLSSFPLPDSLFLCISVSFFLFLSSLYTRGQILSLPKCPSPPILHAFNYISRMTITKIQPFFSTQYVHWYQFFSAR